MRAWVEGNHFPEDSRLEIMEEIGEEALSNLSKSSISFLERLSVLLSNCEWSEKGIESAITDSCEAAGITRREGFASIYWVLIGRENGPKASSLISEIERASVVKLLGSKDSRPSDD